MLHISKIYYTYSNYHSLIIGQDTMTDLSAFVSKHTALLQRYVFAQDRPQFISEHIVLPEESRFFELLLNPLRDITQEKALMKSLNLPEQVKEELYRAKVIKSLKEAATEQETEQAVKQVKQLYNDLYFDFAKPAQFSADPTLQQAQQKQKQVQQPFETEKTVSDVVLKVLKGHPENITKLSSYGLKNIPSDALHMLDQNVAGFLFSKIEAVRSMDPHFIANLLAKVIREQRALGQSSELEEVPSQFFNTLTVEQTAQLKKLLPQIFKGFAYHELTFSQRYQQRLRSFKPIAEMTPAQVLQKRVYCAEILQELKSQNSPFNAFFIDKLTEQILILDQSLTNSDQELFVNYLTNLKQVSFEHFNPLFHKERVEAIGNNAYNETNLYYLESSNTNQSDIISKNVVSLLKALNPQTLQLLSPFLSHKYLAQAEAKVKLAKGLHKSIENIHDIIPLHELAELKQRKQITLLQKNKKTYKIHEDVELFVKIKNVREIKVKIYTFDLVKQYLQNRYDVDEQVNLKFMTPTYQSLLNNAIEDPFEETLTSIKLAELKGKLGLFIVQLEGESVSSRAVIRKGSILVENKLTTTGHELTFFDQQGKQINELTIWRENTIKIAVKDTYTIPFGPQGCENILAAYQGYAEYLQVNISNEFYDFRVDYVYHSESFIVGNKSKVILHPTLKLGEENISLARIGKVTIKVATFNNLNIASTLVLQNVKFRDNEDYVVELPIKSYIKMYGIGVEGEIELINKEKQKISSSKSISIDLEENYNNFVDCYLEKDVQGVHTLKVRGKNGEAVPSVQVVLSYEQFGADFSFSKQLTADERGELSLGKMLQVKKLTVTVNSNGFSSNRTWPINSFENTISYGKSIYDTQISLYLRQGQTLSLPLPCELNPQSDIIFIRNNGITGAAHNYISEIHLTKDRLTTSPLKEANYLLILLRLDRRINISVVKGKEWIGEKIIDGKNNIYTTNKNRKNLVTLGDLTPAVKEGHVEYSIDILSEKQDLPKDVRVHVFAKNYIDSTDNQLYQCQNKACPNPDVSSLYIKQSSYFSDKSFSDEVAYVLKRKKQEVTNGNNLQKPHIFLKRMEVRQTQQNEQRLNRQGQYDDYDGRGGGGGGPMHAKMCMMNQSRAMDQMYANYGMAGNQAVTLNRKLNTHNNFLLQVGHLNANLKRIQNIKVPLGYNQLQVYLFTSDVCLKKQYSLPNSKAQILPLVNPLTQDVDEKSGWTMSRQIYPIHKGNKKSINRNSTWTAVSFTNVADYAKNISITLPDWTLSWNSYTEKKKQEVYDKEYCHELNFFLYKKDKPFFDQVVKPFISNKLSKTFVDLYLLNSQEILQFAHAHLLQKLNYFERALLTEKLVVFGKRYEAGSLANAMELPLKNNKQSSEVFKRFFQTILNAKKQAPPPPRPQTTSASNFEAFDLPMLSMVSRVSRHPRMYASPPPPPAFAPAFSLRDQCMYEDESMVLMSEPQAYEAMEIEPAFEKAKESYKPGFKQTEKTREYTETTYSQLKTPAESANLLPPSLFWAQLAQHYSSAPANQDFLSDKFSALTRKVQFILALSVLPNQSQAQFDLSNQQIEAKSSFLIFVREVKSLPYEQFKSILLNQRFFDPKNQYYFDDNGTQLQKEVDSFLPQKPYTLQTIITNISGANLEIQLLVDIPEGSIPLKSHEQTQINNITLAAYSTMKFQRDFYFPEEGKYHIYPANASRGSSIVAKSSPQPEIAVSKSTNTSKLQTLDNLLRSGINEVILQYLSNKNIFDSNIFDFKLILWKLKDKEFYSQCIDIFEQRNYFNPIVWTFAFHHNDTPRIKHWLQNSHSELGLPSMNLPIFEYYPYYSSRAHKFIDQNKSTIRVKQFQQNYAKFLYSAAFENRLQDPAVLLTHIYYLLLQDRLTEVHQIYNRVKPQHKSLFQIQYDYIDCFLDMYEGSKTNYQTARHISATYLHYPVVSWRKLFTDVHTAVTLSEQEDSQDSTKAEETSFSTTVVNSGKQIKINRPAHTKVIVNFYKIDLELYFSEQPFEEVQISTALTPTKSLQFTGTEFKVERVDRKDYQSLVDMIVEVEEERPNTAVKKVTSFLWTNPDVRVKINESQGDLKVFYGNKKSTTSYCKVYSRGKGDKFYRDGYTDTASSFRYALDLKDVTEFSILVLTDNGGSIHRVKPPILQ